MKKSRKEKIESLIEVGFKIGKIEDNESLIVWLGDETGEADTVMYDFSGLVVSYTIGSGEQGVVNSSTCGEDEWQVLSDEFIDYLMGL